MPNLPPLIESAADLVTTLRATRDGFLAQALEKTSQAQPFLDRAKRLWTILEDSNSIESLVVNTRIKGELRAAAGFSDKAAKKLGAELADPLARWLEVLRAEHPDDWREEILYCYLLTKGDSLGGKMRNIAGAKAGAQLVNAIRAALTERGAAASLVTSKKGKMQQVRWPNRLLLFDKKPKFVAKSIDVILLDDTVPRTPKSLRLEAPPDYLACGELKGGIDPAGADEHWKTANSALGRIRERFSERGPALFFVGAAIETSMASEIFAQLQDGRLVYAANLTVPEQVVDLATWLVSL